MTNLSFGQSPRLVLLEEFTGETCGPCASANPGMNAILDANESIVISLKYQNNIPSAGPNFWPYAQTDISNRTTYYANNYSPHAFIDGNYWNGNAASVTANQLTTRASVASSFEIIVTHTFSPANDIIYTHSVVRATQAVSNANLKLRTAIAERDIYGYTSPNGESEYSHVMRKMLPNGTGTALPGTWAIGDSVVTDLQWTIAASTTAYPSPIWAMLEAIVWVQDDANKQIMQTGHSPAIISIDPAIVSVSGVPSITCSAVTPSIDVTNNEAIPVTSMDINYYLDSQTPTTYNWTGTLNQGATTTINLSSIPMTPGVHAVNVSITSANGAPDLIVSNNNRTIASGQPLPATTAFSETFTTTTFPPANWIKEDNDGVTGWSRVSANSTAPGTGSAKVDFYNSAAGQVDALYPLPQFDLTTAIAPTLTFKVAHQRYATTGANSNDRLEVLLSTNCGTSWTSIWNKSGATLATVTAANTNPYTPAASGWRAESIDLSAYVGQTDILVAFKATSDYGNNAYIDQIFLSPWNVTGINDNNNTTAVSLYPTPSTGNVILDVESISSSKMEISVTNVLGKIVKQMSYDKSEGNLLSIDLSNETNGNYIINIVTENETITKRAVIQK